MARHEKQDAFLLDGLSLMILRVDHSGPMPLFCCDYRGVSRFLSQAHLNVWRCMSEYLDSDFGHMYCHIMNGGIV